MTRILTAAECREKSLQYQALAEASRNTEHSVMFEKMAQSWKEMALRLEDPSILNLVTETAVMKSSFSDV